MRNSFTTYLSGTIVFILLFSYCSRPNEVLGRKNMERLMFDVYVAEALIDNDYTSFSTPERKEALINEVFKKHKTSQAQWDTSLSWYSDRIDLYLKMNDSVRARLKRTQADYDRLLSAENAILQSVSDRSKLSADIPKHYSFSEVNPKNGFRFKLDSTQIADRISDSLFVFSFDAIAVPPVMPNILTASLALEYKDSTIYLTDTIKGNRTYTLKGQKYIPVDTIFIKPNRNDSTSALTAQIDSIVIDTLRSIVGFVHIQDMLGIYRGIHLNRIFLGSENDSTYVQSSDSISIAETDKAPSPKPETLKLIDDDADTPASDKPGRSVRKKVAEQAATQ